MAIQRSPEACNAASKAAVMAIGKHIDPRDRVSVLIVAENFMMGMMMLVAPTDYRAQKVYLDTLTERVVERLGEQA